MKNKKDVMANYEIFGAVVPQMLSTTIECDTSFFAVTWEDATNFALNLNAAVGGVSNVEFGIEARARVVITSLIGGKVLATFETHKFTLAEIVSVELNPGASKLGGASFTGDAILNFLPGQFTFNVEPTLSPSASPVLPPSNGETPIAIKYSLFILGIKVPIMDYTGFMNVMVLPLPTATAPVTFGYTMGAASIVDGIMIVPGFSFPFGTKQARGHVELIGGGFSANWPLLFDVDPFQNVLGGSYYPAQIQDTTGVGLNFTAAVSTSPCPASTTLDGTFYGGATHFSSCALAVPNYVKSVAGNLTLIGEK